MITRILLALIYVQNSITMPHLVVIRLMRVIKWPRTDSDASCVNKKGRGYKGFYSILALAKKSLFFYLPPDCLLTQMSVRKFFFFKVNFIFNNFPPDPVKLVWEGSGNQ